MGCVSQKPYSRQLAHNSSIKQPALHPINSKQAIYTKVQAPSAEDDLPSNLPIIKNEPEVSQINSSGRPQWDYSVPAKQQEMVVRSLIPNQSGIDIVYSSDAHELLNQKVNNQDKNIPVSLVIPQEPAELSLTPNSQRFQPPKYVQSKMGPSLVRITQNVYQSNNNLQIKNAVSVLQDCNVFNQQKTIDIIGFDLRLLKVEIQPMFQPNLEK